MKLDEEGYKLAAATPSPQWQRVLVVMMSKAGLTELTLTVDDIINVGAADTLHVTNDAGSVTVRRVDVSRPWKKP